jgi:hypothetical protein
MSVACVHPLGAAPQVTEAAGPEGSRSARLFVQRGSFGAHSYLVDPASSHMLVSKIKPCMSKYKRLYSETANGSLYQLSFT